MTNDMKIIRSTVVMPTEGQESVYFRGCTFMVEGSLLLVRSATGAIEGQFILDRLTGWYYSDVESYT